MLLRWITAQFRIYLLLAISAASLMAVFVGELIIRDQDLARSIEVTRELSSLAATIEGGTSSSRTMGALILLGTMDNESVQFALGNLPSTSIKQLRHKLGNIAQRYYAETLLLASSNPNITMVSADESTPTIPMQYLARAFQGTPTVFPLATAENPAASKGIYLAAPIRSHQTSTIAGAVIAKISAHKLENLLNSWSSGAALLTSPTGHIFAANNRSTDLPKTFDLSQIGQKIQRNGNSFTAHRQTLEWDDPQGDWSIILFDAKASWWERPLVIFLAVTAWITCLLMFAWLYFLALTHQKIHHAKLLAEAASQAKSDFLANMSHEIRTPMNGIIGMTALAIQTKQEDERTEYLEIVKSSADSLMVIINDILDFSKIEAGKLCIESISFDIHEIIYGSVAPFKAKAREKEIPIELKIAPNLPTPLMGDPTRIRQVLLNLLGNAIKFTERGSITITVDAESSSPSMALLTISVADTGTGIPEEKIQHIFEAFSQADTSTTRKYGGTGLGLSISSQLIGLMGGKLLVSSHVGIGSNFSFTLPLPPAAPPPPLPCVTRNEDPANLTIMVVEDHLINQKVVSRLLEKRGYRVILANNGQEAIDLFQTQAMDLILMDMQMPVMGGLEATEKIRTLENSNDHNGQRKHIPIIAVTANAMEGHRDECLASGMDDYLSKPITPTLLLEKIEKLANTH